MRRLAETFIAGMDAEGEHFTWDSTEAARLDDVCDMLLSTDPPEPVRHSMIMTMGAYLGELMVRHGNGRWSYDADLSEAVVDMPNGLVGYPLSKVAKRIHRGPEHNLFQFYWYALTRDVPPGVQVRETPKQ
ncbi:MAG: hypothetical protein J2P15_03305 [Micromonosporaceae bacterium]|nr:hypothetical protein [Micromonosporaceae bacterium]